MALIPDIGSIDLKAVVQGAFGSRRAAGFSQVPGGMGAGGGGGMMDFRRWDMSKALKDGYEINEWVHACVSIKAQHAASVPWRVSEFADSTQKSMFAYERKGVMPSELAGFLRESHMVKRRFIGYKGSQPIYERKAHLRALPDDPLEQLIEKPNPFSTRYEYIERLVQHLELGGNGIWVKIRGRVPGIPGHETPFELWNLFPEDVRVDRDGQVPLKYHFRPDGANTAKDTERHYDPQDVMHIRRTAPRDSIWGLSPLMAATRSVDTDVMAARFQLNSMSNRGVPDKILTPSTRMNPKAYAEARKSLRQNASEGNARAPWLLNEPFDIKAMSLTSAEVDYIRTRGLNRQAICSIFGIYAPVIAVMEGFAAGSIDAVLKHHWTQTMIPYLERIMGWINQELVAEFSDTRLAWYDPSNVEALNANLMERYRMQKIVHTQGVPMKETNRRFDLGLDLDDVVGADMGFMPAGTVLVKDIVEGNLDPGNTPGNPNTAPEGGDPGEPGDEVAPNEGDPAATPDDGSQEGVSDPEAAAALADLEWAYFGNGHADPHGGVKRWTVSEAKEFLMAAGVGVDPQSVIEDADHFLISVDVDSEGLGLPIDGVKSEDSPAGYLLKFYTGEQTQRRRDDLLAMVRSWE